MYNPNRTHCHETRFKLSPTKSHTVTPPSNFHERIHTLSQTNQILSPQIRTLSRTKSHIVMHQTMISKSDEPHHIWVRSPHTHAQTLVCTHAHTHTRTHTHTHTRTHTQTHTHTHSPSDASKFTANSVTIKIQCCHEPNYVVTSQRRLSAHNNTHVAYESFYVWERQDSLVCVRETWLVAMWKKDRDMTQCYVKERQDSLVCLRVYSMHIHSQPTSHVVPTQITSCCDLNHMLLRPKLHVVATQLKLSRCK